MVVDSKSIEINAEIAIQLSNASLEFIYKQRIEKSEAYTCELIASHNKSVWRLFGGRMTRESFREDWFNMGQTFHLHLLKNCLMHDEEDLAIEIGKAASLTLKLNGPDSKIWLTSEQASVLYSYGGLS